MQTGGGVQGTGMEKSLCAPYMEDQEGVRGGQGQAVTPPEISSGYSIKK